MTEYRCRVPAEFGGGATIRQISPFSHEVVCEDGCLYSSAECSLILSHAHEMPHGLPPDVHIVKKVFDGKLLSIERKK